MDVPQVLQALSGLRFGFVLLVYLAEHEREQNFGLDVSVLQYKQCMLVIRTS